MGIDAAKGISDNQHKSKFDFDLFWKEIQIFGFTGSSTRGDLSIDICINYYCRTDIDEARVISFLRVRTDTISESSIIMETCRDKENSGQNSKFGVSCRSLYASPDNGDS